MSYAERVIEPILKSMNAERIDARAVEEYMRTGHGTLGHLPAEVFKAETREFVEAVRAGHTTCAEWTRFLGGQR